MHMWYDGPTMLGLHGLWWLALLIGIGVLFVVAMGRVAGRRRGDDGRRETPHELLRRRLAAGEITPQDYEERKALLDRDGGTA